MLRDRVWGATVALRLLARALFQPRPTPVTLAERLAALPPHAPTEAEATIHWDDHQIPYIEAARDDDLAVALGMVHAHLRLMQMETLRRLSQGRVAEVAGPLAVDLDRALRLFDFGRAVPAIIAGLSDDTRRWAEGFLRGVNHVIAHAPPPPEFALLGIGREAWTLSDLFTATRLAGADVNWIVWARLLRARATMSAEAWRALWPLLLGGAAPPPEPGAEETLAAFARTGSNAAALAGWRSRSGAALLAADPHLSVNVPNIWLACAFRSPGYNVAGLMPAGFPIVAIGRNPFLAWAGTSLHAASSDLFDASALELTERRETIRVRGAGERTIVLRESPLGPVVSDGMIFRGKAPLALRWTGHDPSDEMAAMLGVMRADGPDSFRAALGSFAIPGQNMIFATRDGRVGKLLAARLPRRSLVPPADLVLAPEAAAAWANPVGTDELPYWPDPESGVVASANDPPESGDVPAGFFFSPQDRVQRINALLSGDDRLGLEAMAALQRDVTVPGMLAVRDRLLARIGERGGRLACVQALADWRGGYEADSRGALAYEVLLAELAHGLDRQGLIPRVSAVWTARALLAEAILATPEAQLQPALDRALRATERVLRRRRNWGGIHRMRLHHQLAAVPLLGRRFRYTDTASPGGNDTLDKTGHGPARGRHGVTYGASARFLADMAEPDANKLVLLGGQDGWLGSSTFLDQAALWQAGRYIDIPLRPEPARAWPHHTVLRPG